MMNIRKTGRESKVKQEKREGQKIFGIYFFFIIEPQVFVLVVMVERRGGGLAFC